MRLPRSLVTALVAWSLALSAACAPSYRPSNSVTTAASSAPSASLTSATGGAGPRLRHLVIVVEENHSYGDIAGNPSAPYMNRLMGSGATFTRMYSITHPSEPNYQALFSGSTQGLTSDACPVSYDAPNLATQLRHAALGFAGYSEGLPSTGWTGCASGEYGRKHAPWNNFSNVPGRVSKPMTAFPTDYSRLPAVSFVIPDLENDMHDGSIATADGWLKNHLAGYVRWSRTHDSALLLTWDEDDYSQDNHVATVIVGDHVRTVHYRQRADLYTLLRTVQWLFRLGPLAHTRQRTPVTSIWTGLPG